MRALQVESLRELAAPLQGLRVLLYGFSGRGFPGGDGAREAVELLPEVGIEAVYTFEGDPALGEKVSGAYDVGLITNTRVGALLGADPRIWTSPRRRVWWHWDLRPGAVAAPLRGLVDHAFLSFNGRWLSPDGTPYDPEDWRDVLGCPVGYCPQGAPLREPVLAPGGPRVLFVGDLDNPRYHRGRRELCAALGAMVLNHRDRPSRLALEGRMPELYRSARYVLSASPLAPGYTSVRTYSILSCGGLMLLHRFPGADELVEDGAVLFDSAGELLERLAVLDGQPEQREAIAARGRELLATRHTVAHRVLSICREVLGCS